MSFERIPAPSWTPRRTLIVLLWIACLAIAFALDRPIAIWVHGHAPLDKRSWLAQVVKTPGDFRFTLVLAAALMLFHVRRWWASALVLLSGIVGGLAYALLKWIAGRRRPVVGIRPFELHPFINGVSGLFKTRDLSFPSGHACLAFATAASLSMLLPRWWMLFFVGACIVAAERVLENAHYLSDTVAGAAVGILSAQACRYLLRVQLNSSVAGERLTMGAAPDSSDR